VKYVVIGVMRAGFDLSIGGDNDFWLVHPPDGPDRARRRPQMFVLGKLARGVSVAEAQRALDDVSVQLAREDGALAGWTGKILTVSEVIGQRTQRIALLLFAATAVIVVIGCFNVVQLLLARSVVRAPDFAVRRALGAGTARLARQLGAEAVVIAVVSGAAGILIAAWLTRLIPAIRPDDLVEFGRVAVDRRMIAFSIAAAVLVSAAGVFIPWLGRNRTSPRALLQRAAGRATAGKSTERLRSVLTGAQVAFSLVLVVGSAANRSEARRRGVRCTGPDRPGTGQRSIHAGGSVVLCVGRLGHGRARHRGPGRLHRHATDT
jgi:hypothetical protein